MISYIKEFNTNGCSRIDDWYFSELTIKSSFYQKNTGEKIDIQKKKYWYQLHARNIYDQALYTT